MDVCGKGRQIGREASRLLPVEAIAGAGICYELRARARRRQGLLFAAGKERIPLTPDDESGRFNCTELPSTAEPLCPSAWDRCVARWDDHRAL